MKKLAIIFSLLFSFSAIATEKTPKEGVDFVYLDGKDLREMGAVISSYFEALTEQVLVPQVPEGYQAVKSAKFNGVLSKSDFEVEFDDGEKLDFKNVKLTQNKEGKGGFGEFSLISICVGSDCNKVFAIVFIREQGGFIYNWPLVFKKVGEKYLLAYQKKGAVYEDAKQDDKEYKKPPQVVVAEQLEAKLTQHEQTLLTTIRDRMRKSDAAYSALFFLGMNKPFFAFDFKLEGEKLKFAAPVEFFPHFERKNLNFKGEFALSTKGMILNQPEAETALEVVAIDGKELFVMIFDQSNYTALIPGVKRGMSAIVCSLLEENGAVFESCQLVPSSVAIGTIALEGKVDGPIYVRDGFIAENLDSAKNPPPVAVKEELKAEFEMDNSDFSNLKF